VCFDQRWSWCCELRRLGACFDLMPSAVYSCVLLASLLFDLRRCACASLLLS
jgi:hypothetical protein